MAKVPGIQNLWEVAVLALLRERRMHPYEMQRLLRERHKDELLVLRRGSLYHAINRLLRLDLIDAAETSRSGRRPERTVYRITVAGRKALKAWIGSAISASVQEPSEFMAAMSFLVHLTPADAIPKLEQRARVLERRIAGIEAKIPELLPMAGRINLIESEYLCAMWRAEMKWVRNLAAELSSGSFSWDLKTLLRQAGRPRTSAAGSGGVR